MAIHKSIEMETFVKEVKDTIPWSYVIEDLNVDVVKGAFYEEKRRKTCRVITV